MLFTQSQFGIIMHLLTKMHCIPLCSLQHNHWHCPWSMWTGVTAIVILFDVCGGSSSCYCMGGDWSDPTTGRGYCSWGNSTIFHLPQCCWAVNIECEWSLSGGCGKSDVFHLPSWISIWEHCQKWPSLCGCRWYVDFRLEYVRFDVVWMLLTLLWQATGMCVWLTPDLYSTFLS